MPSSDSQGCTTSHCRCSPLFYNQSAVCVYGQISLSRRLHPLTLSRVVYGGACSLHFMEISTTESRCRVYQVLWASGSRCSPPWKHKSKTKLGRGVCLVSHPPSPGRSQAWPPVQTRPQLPSCVTLSRLLNLIKFHEAAWGAPGQVPDKAKGRKGLQQHDLWAGAMSCLTTSLDLITQLWWVEGVMTLFGC